MKIPVLLMSRVGSKEPLPALLTNQVAPTNDRMIDTMSRVDREDNIKDLAELRNLSGLDRIVQPERAPEAEVQETEEERRTRELGFLDAEPQYDAEGNMYAVVFNVNTQDGKLPLIRGVMHLAHAQADALYRKLPEFKFAVRQASQVRQPFPVLLSSVKRLTAYDPKAAISAPLIRLLRHRMLSLVVVDSESFHVTWPKSNNPQQHGEDYEG